MVSSPPTGGTCYARPADPPADELPARVRKHLGHDVLQLQRTEETFQKVLLHDKLHLALPLPGVTAGSVLKHAFAVFESLLQRRKPMTYKFGYTHCPHFRWCNAAFGYAHAVQKYERMEILYVAAEPVGPAFLESALIHHYKGHSIISYITLCCIRFSSQCLTCFFGHPLKAALVATMRDWAATLWHPMKKDPAPISHTWSPDLSRLRPITEARLSMRGGCIIEIELKEA